MDLNGDSWPAGLCHHARLAVAAAPIDKVTRDRQRAAALVVKRKLSEDEKAERGASIGIAPNPLYVDSSQQARLSSRPTFAEATVERGVAK